ncbi:hypothetical protein TNIN_441211 [Trichonephila inaurata madagascariensis]|uniref:Uncharacterized protein n=1 Tax=Trichonephila inaurata madagascariensis TaxID=2747483 RepID=A0A8X7CQR0_9ARAC|nr:hypothetical protein TNIN_441211 [Trichonephila inaurata madagascariensis]
MAAFRFIKEWTGNHLNHIPGSLITANKKSVRTGLSVPYQMPSKSELTKTSKHLSLLVVCDTESSLEMRLDEKHTIPKRFTLTATKREREKRTRPVTTSFYFLD